MIPRVPMKFGNIKTDPFRGFKDSPLNFFLQLCLSYVVKLYSLSYSQLGPNVSFYIKKNILFFFLYFPSTFTFHKT